MKAWLREVVMEYRRLPVTEPSCLIHIRDDRGVVHAVNNQCTLGCKKVLLLTEKPGEFLIIGNEYPRSGAYSAAVPTWDEVDCMACLATVPA